MTNFSSARILAGAAAAVAITLAVSGNALAHGGGMGGMGGMGHMGGMTDHPTTSFVTTNKGVVHLGSHDGRRFHFIRAGVAYPSGCIYSWTELGRVRICPDYGY